jgi:hypothetical protein
MSDLTWGEVADWIARFLAFGVAGYAVRVIQRERSDAQRDAELRLRRRLAELLPLPHFGDRGALLGMLRDIAPGYDLALYTAGEPALLVFRRDGLEPPGPEEARWIEVHREALLAGRVVREPACGAIVPLRLRNGALTGALIVATGKDPSLDPTALATLRHVAALVACIPTLVAPPPRP